MNIVKETLESHRHLLSDQERFLFSSKSFSRLWLVLNGTPVWWQVYEGNNLIASLAGVEFGLKPLKRFQAQLDGLYGRIYFADDSEDDHLTIKKALFEAIKREGYIKIDYVDYFQQIDSNPFKQVIEMITPQIDISSADWEPPDSKIRSEIRKAEREQVIVETFDREKHFQSFIRLMLDTEKRHGREPKYPNSFFEQLAILAEKDTNILWLWCESSGVAVVSHVYFIIEETALNWQIYFDKQFSSLKANQLMQFKAIRMLQERGVKYLNLGASPEDAGTLQDYKQKWGGVDYKYNIYQYRSLLGKLR